MALGITLSFGYAEHAPQPHGVRIAVAAPAGAQAKLQAGLARAQPGGFDLVTVSGARAAAESVRSQTSAGALIVPPSGAATIVTAGAEGVSQQQAITAALTAAARSMRRPTRLLDAVPLSTEDRAGLSSFVFGLGLLIPSVIGGVGLFLLGMRLRLWWRVGAAILFAACAAAGGVLAIDLGLFTTSRVQIGGVGHAC